MERRYLHRFILLKKYDMFKDFVSGLNILARPSLPGSRERTNPGDKKDAGFLVPAAAVLVPHM